MNPIVSVICITYNHENYIAQTIESFVMQKTNFSFEILIYDDASTDRTGDIIREYEKIYPTLINPIYQTENQYSKGYKVGHFNIQRAKGKYLAVCEGDDYWTDCYKLQKQVDIMEKNSDYSLCVHSSLMVHDKDNRTKLIRPSIGNKTFTVEEVIKGGGGLFATNSMMYRTQFGLNRPDFYEAAPVGDYPLTIYLALMGKIYYIDECMSAYRVSVNGSWTERELSTIEKKVDHFDKIAKMLDDINEFTKYTYDKTIDYTKRHNQFNLLLEQNLYVELLKEEYKDFYRTIKLKDKLYIFMSIHMPRLLDILKSIKRKII